MELKDLYRFYEVRGRDEPAISTLNSKISESDVCPACGRRIEIYSRSELQVVVRGRGNQWPDIMGISDGIVVSENVIIELNKVGATGYVPHEIQIVEVQNSKLPAIIPRYYVLQIFGFFDVRLDQVDDVGGSVCPVCHQRNAMAGNAYRWKPKRLVPDIETWSGDDFLKIRNLRTKHSYCTERIIELARQNKWTNFLFGGSLPEVTVSDKKSLGISYMDPNWRTEVKKEVRLRNLDLLRSDDALD